MGGRLKIVTTALVVAGSLALFLAFFVVWVIAPITVVLLFYVVFFVSEERLSLARGVRLRVHVRRERLAAEAKARRASLRRRKLTDDR